MRWTWVCALCALACTTIADAASAQRRNRNPGPNEFHSNRFFLEPYGGVFKDAYDNGADDAVGYVAGLSAGISLGARFRLLASLGYSASRNVMEAVDLPDYHVYNNTWIMTTGGAEFDVVPGRTSAALGLQGGTAWRRLDLAETVGTPVEPPQPTGRYSTQEVIVPSLTVRHQLGARASITAGLADYMFNVRSGTALHSPALTLGVLFR